MRPTVELTLPPWTAVVPHAPLPYLRLDGAPREGLVVTAVSSVADFRNRFPDAALEERAAVDHLFLHHLAYGIDIIHGPEQTAKQGSPVIPVRAPMVWFTNLESGARVGGTLDAERGVVELRGSDSQLAAMVEALRAMTFPSAGAGSSGTRPPLVRRHEAGSHGATGYINELGIDFKRDARGRVDVRVGFTALIPPTPPTA